MSFIDFLKGKKKEDINQSVTEETADNDDNQEPNKEDKSVAKNGKRKIYMYIAVDSNNNIILDNADRPYFGKTKGSTINWERGIRKAIIDDSLKVEVTSVSNKERDKADQDARNKLLEIAADRIEAAKQMKYGNPEPLNEEAEYKEEDTTVITAADDVENFAQPEAEAAEELNKSEFKESETDKEEIRIEAADKNDVTEIINKINNVTAATEQLAADFKNDVDDICDTMSKNKDEIKNYIESQTDEANNSVVKVVVNKVQEGKKAIIDDAHQTKNEVTKNQNEIASKVKTISRRVEELGESVEGIEGKLSGLEKLDTITGLLQNKGLTMSMEIPPVNADEEDIVNLVRYSRKITEQLGYAARTLLRKQEAFRSQEENNSNEQQAMDKRIATAREKGIIEGKREVIRQLVAKYEDIDTIKNSKTNHVHVIWILLNELGAVIDGDGFYEKGNVIDFSEADIERLIGTYSKLEGAGKYKVVKTGLVFEGEIINKAVFKKITDR